VGQFASHLPEHPSVGIGTVLAINFWILFMLIGCRGIVGPGPSASLDKSAIVGLLNCNGSLPYGYGRVNYRVPHEYVNLKLIFQLTSEPRRKAAMWTKLRKGLLKQVEHA